MHEIKCPHCEKIFTIDEASYAEIQKQVHNAEFNQELESRLHAIDESNKKDLELAKKDVAEDYQKTLNEKDREIAELKGKISSAETEKKLAVTEATAQIERELDKYKNDLDNAEELSKSREMMLRQNYEQQIKDREDTIDRLKDMKAKLSTKMVGETLEQHCQNEFNSIRATAFPRAKFGKDNAVSASGSKGDFIFRDFDEKGNEIVSIMFEMKNENDTTATKHKNEDFFKELDKDRREKKCEYAVLVSLLEADSELYNRGITDVSYEYEKMYVIRPQFFLPLISIIANTARNSLEYKAALAEVRNQNIDITNFEEKLNGWKESFMLNSDRASKNFQKAIEDIDKSIKNLEETKQKLLLTIKNFDTANNKLDDLTIKRLTRGNETMTKMFEDLK